MTTWIQTLAAAGTIPLGEWAMAGLAFGPTVAVLVGVDAFCRRRWTARSRVARTVHWFIVLIGVGWTMAGLALLGPAGNRTFVAIGLLLAGMAILCVSLLPMLLNRDGQLGRSEQRRLAAEEFRRG